MLPRPLAVLGILAVLLAPAFAPLAAAATAWTEAWENGIGNWWYGEPPPTTNCSQGYVTGCALTGLPPFGENLNMQRGVDWAIEDGDGEVALKLKTSAVSGLNGFTLGVTMQDENGVGDYVEIRLQDNKIVAIYWETGVTTPIYTIANANTWYKMLLRFGADGVVVGEVQSTAGVVLGQAQIHVHPVGYWRFDTVGLGAYHPPNFPLRYVWVDDVEVTGDIGPITRPDPPQNLQARTTPTPEEILSGTGPGLGEAYVTWEAPAHDGNSPITGYTLWRKDPDGTKRAIFGGNALSYHDSGLGFGTYTYTVTASNARGASDESTPAVATSYAGQPPITTIRVVDGQRLELRNGNPATVPFLGPCIIKVETGNVDLYPQRIVAGDHPTTWLNPGTPIRPYFPC